MPSVRFVTLSKNGSNPAYRGARIGMDRLAKARGIQVEHFVPMVDDSIPEQEALLARLVRERPDAVLVSPAHESQLDPVLEQLQQTGVPVVMFVGRTRRHELARCHVGSNDFAMTQAVARAVAQRLGGRGAVAILDGNPLGILYEPRARGFRAGLAEHPGLRIVGARDGDFLHEPARHAMRELLDLHGPTDAVLVANDFMGLGALEALHERGLHPIVGSVNATPQGVAAIRSGEMLVSAAFNAMAMGCLAMEAALRLLKGQEVPERIVLPAELVDATNLQAWDLPYEQRPLPDWDHVIAGQRAA